MLCSEMHTSLLLKALRRVQLRGGVGLEVAVLSSVWVSEVTSDLL